jgi:hypothetical protein
MPAKAGIQYSRALAGPGGYWIPALARYARSAGMTKSVRMPRGHAAVRQVVKSQPPDKPCAVAFLCRRFGMRRVPAAHGSRRQQPFPSNRVGRTLAKNDADWEKAL